MVYYKENCSYEDQLVCALFISSLHRMVMIVIFSVCMKEQNISKFQMDMSM